jgi:hypothetical protein
MHMWNLQIQKANCICFHWILCIPSRTLGSSFYRPGTEELRIVHWSPYLFGIQTTCSMGWIVAIIVLYKNIWMPFILLSWKSQLFSILLRTCTPSHFNAYSPAKGDTCLQEGELLWAWLWATPLSHPSGGPSISPGMCSICMGTDSLSVFTFKLTF